MTTITREQAVAALEASEAELEATAYAIEWHDGPNQVSTRAKSNARIIRALADALEVGHEETIFGGTINWVIPEPRVKP